MSRRPFDPLGRDGLFLPPQGPAHPQTRRSSGRAALFSAPPRRAGDVVIDCASCGGRTPVPRLQLPVKLLASAFVPFRRHPHLMRCPACRAIAWCRVEWAASG